MPSRFMHIIIQKQLNRFIYLPSVNFANCIAFILVVKTQIYRLK